MLEPLRNATTGASIKIPGRILPRQRRSRLFVCLAFVTLIASPGFAQSTVVGEGSAAPAFELKTLDATTVRLSDYRGKVVVLNFWATWCTPCRRETPTLVHLDQAYRQKGVTVLGINVDDDAESASKFVAELAIPYPILVANDDTTHDYIGLGGLPVTILIGPDGTIIKKFSGTENIAQVETYLKSALSLSR